MFKKYNRNGLKTQSKMLKMKKFIGLILLGLIFNGCAVYFAIEFDTCKKCTKICPSDTTKVENKYGDWYGKEE